MRWIVAWSLRSRFVVLALAVGLTVLGITQLRNASVDTLPEFRPPMVEVHTEALGLSAEEVEQLITVPLEQDLLNGVAFLDEIESVSIPGLSSVVMTFEPGTDELDARQVVQERLTQAHALPQVANPPQMLQPLSSTSRLAIVRLSSSDLSLIETSVLARWVIVPRLLGVEGVANAAIWGFRDRQLQVLVDPEELGESEVSLNQMIRTVGNALEVSPLTFLEASLPGTGGWIDTVNQRLHVFHEQAIRSADELAQIPLLDAEGEALLVDRETVALGEIAEVREDHQPLIGDTNCPDGPCLLLVLEKFPDANTPEVTRGVEAALDAMRPGLGGLEIDTSIYRPADYIETGFRNLWTVLLMAAIGLALALGLVLYDWRRVLIAGVTVPLALLTAVLVLHLRGDTVNMIVVAGLAAGLVIAVDDAVTHVEHAARARQAHSPGGNGAPFARLVGATLRARGAALYAALVVAVVLLPVFFLPGTAGAFLPPLVLSLFLAMAASMLVALTVTPALTIILLGRTRTRRDVPPTMEWLATRYGSAARRLVSGRVPALGTMGVLLVLGLLMVPLLHTTTEPALQERDVLLHLEASPGTSLSRMNQAVSAVVDHVADLDGVEDVGAHVGRAITSDQIVNVNEAEIWISVAASADYTSTLAAVDAVVDGVAGISHELMTYSGQRVGALLGGGHELTVRVYGENEHVLREKAEDVQAAVTAIDGVEETAVDLTPHEPAITVVVDLERAREHGVKPGDVRRAAAVLLSGITVGNLFEEQKVFDVVVWGQPEIRQTAADVRALLIDTPTGEPVELAEVADVRVQERPAAIRHHSVMSYLDVLVEVQGRSAVAVAADVQRAIRSVDFPLEYHAEVRGDFAERAAARTRGLAVAIGAVLAVFLLLQAAFASWRLSFIAFVALPLAVTGGLVAAWLSRGGLGLASIVGLAAVLGVTTRAVILLLRHYQHLQYREGEPFDLDLVVQGTRDRLVPTLAPLVSVAAVMAPFAVGGGLMGLEIVQPMAVVVLGGLVTSGLVSLVVVPHLYLRFGFVGQPDTTYEDLVITIPEAELHRPMAPSG